jgi:predicted GTPase
VVDGKVALGEQDIVIRDMILQAQKKSRTIVLVNKLDGKVYGRAADMLIAEYYEM